MQKNFIKLAIVLAVFLLGSGYAAEEPAHPVSAVPAIETLDLSPPPVPGFMLQRPAKPLTLEQMQQQAEEAASKVRPQK